MLLRALMASAALSLTAFAAHAGEEAESVIAAAASQISNPVTGKDAFRKSIDVPTVARFTLGKYATASAMPTGTGLRRRSTPSSRALLRNTRRTSQTPRCR